MQAGRHPMLWGIVAIGLMGGAFFLLVLALSTLLTGRPEMVDRRAKIAIVTIEGLISSERAGRTVRQLTKYGDDPAIKAIVLRIDSPGGGVAPSQEIYQEIQRIRADGKLVVASLGSLAASGEYYVASAAEHIIANPGTITGSIGVLIQLANAEELLRKIGVASTSITSAPFKDSGSPTRPLQPEERAIFQSVVDDVHQQFIQAVAHGRNLPEEEVRQYADGRIYSGRQAKDLHLIDDLGTLADAVAYAATAVGIVGKPQLVEERKERWWFRWLLEGLSRLPALQPFPTGDAVLQYRWLY